MGVAIPMALFCALMFFVVLATVVGPLIGVPVMLALVWVAMRLAPRWFPTSIRTGAPSSIQVATPGP